MAQRGVSIGIVILALLPSLSLAAGETRRDPAMTRRPNIVLIVSDDQRWTDFGFMGHQAIKTPHLDRLAAHSALFRRGYVPTSLCRPSLATLVTGLYPHQHGITGNDPPVGTDRSAMLKRIRAVDTLPQLLARPGYRSFQSGKWWEGNFAEGGFSSGMTHGDPARGGRHGDIGLRIGREGLKPVFDFIESCGESPYFLWYAPMMPHVPHNPPARLLSKYEAPGRPAVVARYFAMCEWFDETCGQLLDFIDKKGQSRNTLVLFVVDNGWAPPKQPDQTNSRRSNVSPPYGPRSKQSPYDGGVRTPILVSWPDRIRPAEYPTVVSSIDIAPTALAAAGIPKHRQMPGLNLLHVIAAGGSTPRTTIFGEIYTHTISDVEAPTRGLKYRWCVESNWKLIAPADGGEKVELYDVLQDPSERRDRAAAEPAVVHKLSADLDAWWPMSR